MSHLKAKKMVYSTFFDQKIYFFDYYLYHLCTYVRWTVTRDFVYKDIQTKKKKQNIGNMGYRR